MTHHMLDFVRTVAWYGKWSGPVLEIGSYIESEQDHLDLRRAFPPGTAYCGIDRIPGKGVDEVVDMFNTDAMSATLDRVDPTVVICCYVLEHVWEINAAARALTNIQKRNPKAWLWASTHQNQPYHGTSDYDDYWRITASGMRNLFADDEIGGASIFVHADTSNPTDVVAIRHPVSIVWPTEVFTQAMRAATAHWEQFC